MEDIFALFGNSKVVTIFFSAEKVTSQEFISISYKYNDVRDGLRIYW